MGRFIPALISLDDDEKYVVYDTADGMKKVSRVVSPLPEVDADDNGKLLGVDSGEWKAVSAPSGGGNLLVHATLNQAETAFVLDKTWNEIKTAFEAGIAPILIYYESDVSGYEGFYYTLMSIWSGYDEDPSDMTYGVNFVYFTVGEDSNLAGEPWLFTTDSADEYPQSEISQ